MILMVNCPFSDCPDRLKDLQHLQDHLFEDHGIFTRYSQGDTIAICYDRFDRLWSKNRFCFRWVSTIFESMGSKFGLVCEERKKSMFMWIINLGQENGKQFRFKINVKSGRSAAEISWTGDVHSVTTPISEMLTKGEHLQLKRVQLFDKFLTRLEEKRYWFVTISIWDEKATI